MRTPRKGIWLLMRNSSAQDFAFTAKSVKTCKLSQKNLPLAEGDLEWADSVTGKPKAELLPARCAAMSYPLKYTVKYCMI